MLHELLLALSGYPGSVFVESSEGRIQVAPDLPFLNPAEVCLLNRLCKLGTHFKRFQDFIAKYSHHPATNDTLTDVPPRLKGLYLQAFCAGLDHILQPYRRRIAELELEILTDHNLSTSYVQCQLEQYQLIFPALNNLVEQLKRHKAHGCYLLDLIHKATVCGLPEVKDLLQKLLKICHAVLYKQISAWMLHGMLLDTYGEFFIHKNPAANQTKPNEDDEEDELGLAGVTGKQLQRIMRLDEFNTAPCYEQYALRSDMLPSHIPTRVANKILFVGESVQMFKSDGRTTMKQSDSVLKNKEDDFARELHELSKMEEFSLMTFEEIVDKIRTCVAERLWKLVVEESNLFGKLKTLKDFYLLGRGELFLTFIDQSQDLLNSPPSGTTQLDVDRAFHQAAGKVLLDDENLLQKFSITIDANSSKSLGKQSDSKPSLEPGWNVLGLNCVVDWPLHILFTNACLSKYNSLFRYLILVKRVQSELHQLWARHMYNKHRQMTAFEAEMWQLRSHMAFLLDNLQYYLQADVIESQYSVLVEKIQNTRDFEAIRLAHDQFLTSLLAQTFLLMRPVHSCLTDILDGCHSCYVLACSVSGRADDRELTQLREISKTFQRQTGLLFIILSSVRSHQSSPHLAQLLLRIDFNRYLTQAGGKLGGSQRKEAT